MEILYLRSRNLLAEKCKSLQTTTDAEMTQNIEASLWWAQPCEKPWSLSCEKGSVYNLEGELGADAYQPMKFAGWIAVRLEGGKEPIRCEPVWPPAYYPSQQTKLDWIKQTKIKPRYKAISLL